MSRISKKQLDDLVRTISIMANIPNSRSDAEKRGKNEYISLDYAPVYGGYRLVLVQMPSFAHYGIFGGNGCEPRRSAREMLAFLQGIISGMSQQNIVTKL